MSSRRPEKLSERLELRLPYSDKRRFLEACRQAGDVPSEVLRSAMKTYVARVEMARTPTLAEDLVMKFIRNPLKTLATAGAGIAAMVLLSGQTSMADADPDAFSMLDKNEDSILTEADFQDAEGDMSAVAGLIEKMDADGSGGVSREEFESGDKRVMVRKVEIHEDSTGDFTDLEGERRTIIFRADDGEGSLSAEEAADLLEENGISVWSTEEDARIVVRRIERREETIQTED